jgi:hypothetical protein
LRPRHRCSNEHYNPTLRVASSHALRRRGRGKGEREGGRVPERSHMRA